MRKNENNYAFIDSQNLYLNVRRLGWDLDFRRFRIYLAEKYGVKKAYVFIGYIQAYHSLYRSLQAQGFVIIFKPTVSYKDGAAKGNCDAELVLQAMIDIDNYEKAVLVSGDGDFYCLARYLIENKKLKSIMIPNGKRFSALLNFPICKPYLRYMDNLENKLGYKKEKAP